MTKTLRPVRRFGYFGETTMGTSAATIRSYRDLKVWRVSMNLVTHVYRVSSAFPRHETYGLTSQVRRAAVSISSNIAEGHGREHLGDYLYHLSVANGSLMELETQVLIAGRLVYTDQPSIDALMLTAVDVGCLLAGLIRALKRRQHRRLPGT